jgi:hypothetical protein
MQNGAEIVDLNNHARCAHQRTHSIPIRAPASPQAHQNYSSHPGCRVCPAAEIVSVRGSQSVYAPRAMAAVGRPGPGDTSIFDARLRSTQAVADPADAAPASVHRHPPTAGRLSPKSLAIANRATLSFLPLSRSPRRPVRPPIAHNCTRDHGRRASEGRAPAARGMASSSPPRPAASRRQPPPLPRAPRTQLPAAPLPCSACSPSRRPRLRK